MCMGIPLCIALNYKNVKFHVEIHSKVNVNVQKSREITNLVYYMYKSVEYKT